jgi:hypothetical protein
LNNLLLSLPNPRGDYSQPIEQSPSSPSQKLYRETVQKNERKIMVSNNVVDFKNEKLAGQLKAIEEKRNTSFSNFDSFLSKVFSFIL